MPKGSKKYKRSANRTIFEMISGETFARIINELRRSEEQTHTDGTKFLATEVCSGVLKKHCEKMDPSPSYCLRVENALVREEYWFAIYWKKTWSSYLEVIGYQLMPKALALLAEDGSFKGYPDPQLSRYLELESRLKRNGELLSRLWHLVRVYRTNSPEKRQEYEVEPELAAVMEELASFGLPQVLQDIKNLFDLKE